MATLVGRTVELHVRRDVMVNNAGGPGNLSPITECDADVFARAVTVHANGPLLGIKYAGREMAARGSGSVVNVGSAAGKAGGWEGL
ncbi:SDR family NAD(P)-dependent oxidoreductase [Kitasatospora sp. NPDC048540]|uniref:SDR family NAD(P)-dependent oxidoreductase n=1 Tax=Kitasatospora sp. NPDC048540 TaxID=3155634 RepID=UPI00340D3F8E